MANEFKKQLLTDKKALYTLYFEAEKAILAGQSYSIGSRTLERADLKDVVELKLKLENEIQALESEIAGTGRRRCFRITPRDL